MAQKTYLEAACELPIYDECDVLVVGGGSAGHSAAVAKGMDLNGMMAEIFGKVTGVCKGRGGSMHIADKDVGVLGANGIVGPSMALACGAAFAHKRRGDRAIAVSFFGDGATNEGIFHEAMNLASVWRLPVMFVCTNNLYGMSTHISRVMKNTNLADRAIPYGIEAVTVDGNDAEAVYDTVSAAREKILSTGDPMMIVENTYRISGHSKSDGNQYRTKEEIAEWKKRDPILLHKQKLIERGLATAAEIEALEEATTEQLERAVKYAIDSPYPKVEDIYEDVYAE